MKVKCNLHVSQNWLPLLHTTTWSFTAPFHHLKNKKGRGCYKLSVAPFTSGRLRPTCCIQEPDHLLSQSTIWKEGRRRLIQTLCCTFHFRQAQPPLLQALWELELALVVHQGLVVQRGLLRKHERLGAEVQGARWGGGAALLHKVGVLLGQHFVWTHPEVTSQRHQKRSNAKRDYLDQ